MSFVDEVLNNVADLAEEVKPYASIVFGSDPPDNGLCMIPNGGWPDSTHFDKGMEYKLPVLLNGKHKDQKTVLETLIAIHKVLTKTKNYAQLATADVQIVNIETTALPQVIGREQNSQWLCGSSFEISFYWR